MAGVGHGEGVGGIEVLGRLVEVEDGLEHGGYLLFGGVAVASDGLLDGGGFILGVAQVAAHGCGDGHALCTPEFEHGLDVFAEEGGFDGEVVGVEGVDDAEGGVEDAADALVEVGEAFELEDVHGEDADVGVFVVEEAVAEDACAGVDAED